MKKVYITYVRKPTVTQIQLKMFINAIHYLSEQFLVVFIYLFKFKSITKVLCQRIFAVCETIRSDIFERMRSSPRASVHACIESNWRLWTIIVIEKLKIILNINNN